MLAYVSLPMYIAWVREPTMARTGLFAHINSIIHLCVPHLALYWNECVSVHHHLKGTCIHVYHQRYST